MKNACAQQVVELLIRHSGKNVDMVRLKSADGKSPFDELIGRGTKNMMTRRILSVRTPFENTAHKTPFAEGDN